jgi:hypothetical protein
MFAVLKLSVANSLVINLFRKNIKQKEEIS